MRYSEAHAAKSGSVPFALRGPQSLDNARQLSLPLAAQRPPRELGCAAVGAAVAPISGMLACRRRSG